MTVEAEEQLRADLQKEYDRLCGFRQMPSFEEWAQDRLTGTSIEGPEMFLETKRTPITPPLVQRGPYPIATSGGAQGYSIDVQFWATEPEGEPATSLPQELVGRLDAIRRHIPHNVPELVVRWKRERI